MKQFIGFVAVLGLFAAGVAQAAAPASVILSGEPEVLVVENESCQELIYTYLVSVAAGAEALTVKDVTFEVKNDEGDVVADATHDSAYALSADAFATSFQAVAIPCLAQSNHEVYSDDFTANAGESEDFTVKVFFTPEFAGNFAAYLTGIVFDETSDEEATEPEVAQARGGAGPCLNCEHDVVLGGTLSTLSMEDLEAMLADEGASDEEIGTILAFIKMLVSLKLI